MRIVVAGSGQLAVGLTQSLLESDHEVVGIVQNGRKTRGWARDVKRGWALVSGPADTMLGLAGLHRLPVCWIDRTSPEELAPLRSMDADLLLVGGFSIILRRPILDVPRIGCVNVHSSLLPRHRGPNPFAAAVLSGDTESGVTFHIMDEGIDTGPIVEQFPFGVSSKDTTLSVYEQACHVAAANVVAVVDLIARSGLNGRPQDERMATYEHQIGPEDARIDWSRPAAEIDRQRRGCRSLLLPSFAWRGRTVHISQMKWDAAPVAASPGTVLQSHPFVKVATGLGTVTIATAYVRKPIPHPWPFWRERPERGEILE